MSVDCSIVIITKNQKNLLQQLIPAIRKQTCKKTFEIIVVDSGSTDGAAEYLKTQKVTLVQIQPEEFGYVRAFNIGAKQTLGKYLIRLSGDAIPVGSDWLAKLIKPMENPKIGAVYGKYILSGKFGYNYPNFWTADKFPDRKIIFSVKPDCFMGLFDNLPLQEKFNRIFLLAGACYTIRKEIWDKRPLNEKVIGGDDAEYAFFLHSLGYDVVYNPQAVVLHEHTIRWNRPVWYTNFMDFGISKWQFVFYREILRAWLDRFVVHKYDQLLYRGRQV